MTQLTKAEQEVLSMLLDEYLTQKKIAIRRGTSKQAVSKIINGLRKKGVINLSNERLTKGGSHSQPLYTSQPKLYKGEHDRPLQKVNHDSKTIRLHMEKYRLKILWKGDFYENLRSKKANTLFIDGNSVLLYDGSVVVHSNKSFFGKTPADATGEACNYWRRFFNRLENDLKVILVKPRSQNIKRFQAHYAEIDNELARECEVEGDRIVVRCDVNGKVWFMIDNSFNYREAETTDPDLSEVDMQEVVQPFFNDLRRNRPPVLNDVWRVVSSTVEMQKELYSGVNVVAAGLAALMPKKPKEKPESEDRGVPEYVG